MDTFGIGIMTDFESIVKSLVRSALCYNGLPLTLRAGAIALDE